METLGDSLETSDHHFQDTKYSEQNNGLEVSELDQQRSRRENWYKLTLCLG